MSLQSRLSLAAKVAQTCAELQEQRSRRTKTIDPLMAAALVHLDAAIAELARTIVALAGSVEDDGE